MIDKQMFSRSIGLIGEEDFSNISSKTIAVIGLGGVGGTALEALSRCGFRSFILVDYDVVDKTNLNRQILYHQKSIKQQKVKEAEKHILSINPNALITSFNMKMNAQNMNIFNKREVDFIIDAIDDVNGKIAIAKYALSKGIPFITSLGMANRLDPSQVEIIKLDKTTNDPLAKKIRHDFKNNEIDTKKVMTVFSKEKPISKGKELNSMMMVPSAAGLNIAYYIIKFFTKR